MPTASSLTTLLFVLLALLMAGVGAAFLRRSGVGAVVVFLLGYLLLPAVLAGTGRLDRYDPMPAPALLLILALTVGTVVTAFSRIGDWVGGALSLAVLVGFQGFRIPVELLLHRLFVEGVVPVQMTYAGRNFDIVSGATALLVAGWISRRRDVARGLLLAWNFLGLALLVNIVAIAVLSTPVSFRRFPDGPANTLPSVFPFVWLPTILVQMALFGHLVLFRRLRRSVP